MRRHGRWMSAAGLTTGLSAAVLAFAAATAPVKAEPVTVRGTVKFVGTVTVSASIPESVPISGRVSVSFNGTGGSRLVTASATMTRTGRRAVMRVSLPYRFTIDQAPAKITVVFGVNANPATGSVFTLTDAFLPMPANGAVTSVSLVAAL